MVPLKTKPLATSMPLPAMNPRLREAGIIGGYMKE